MERIKVAKYEQINENEKEKGEIERVEIGRRTGTDR